MAMTLDKKNLLLERQPSVAILLLMKIVLDPLQVWTIGAISLTHRDTQPDQRLSAGLQCTNWSLLWYQHRIR